ncbi:MAG: alpha/beta fold hydrolase [Thermoleophilaceae bacterium]|nr:alpha/beta fold hydrolase [Thermoleophilaceae bacterium]
MPPGDLLERGDPELPALVFLHAAGTGPEIWLPQLEHFAEHFHVLAPDLNDDAVDAAFSVPTAAAAVAELIDTKAGGTAIVVGISLGAFVALQLAVDDPEKVQALVLSGGQSRPARAGLFLTYVLLALVPKRFTIRPGGSKRALLRSYRSLFSWDLHDQLKDVKARTLVLCGTKDRPNLAAARELAAKIPGAELKLIEDAGHLWVGGRAREFNEILTAFADSR